MKLMLGHSLYGTWWEYAAYNEYEIELIDIAFIWTAASERMHAARV